MAALHEQVIRILNRVFNGRCIWESSCRATRISLRSDRCSDFLRREYDFRGGEFDVDYMLERDLAHGATQLRNRAPLSLRERLKAVLVESVRAGCSPQLGDWITA